VVYADAGNDTVRAGTGDDILHGLDGHDRLEAGEGNDTVTSGLGKRHPCWPARATTSSAAATATTSWSRHGRRPDAWRGRR
jgi:hypothetical protein